MKQQKNRMFNERDFVQDPNYVAPDKEKEALVLKLGTMITDRYLVKYTRSMKTDDPEYWGLREMLTPEMVDMCNKMKLRKHYTLDDLIKLKEILRRSKEQLNVRRWDDDMPF